MASIRKGHYTIAIPAGAKIVTENGKAFAKFIRGGKRVKALVVGDGSRCRVETDHWFIRYKEGGKWKEVKGFTDKRASESYAEDIQRRVDRGQAGVNPFGEQHGRPIGEHIDDWREALLNGKKPLSREEADRFAGRVRAVVGACGFASVTDLAKSEEINGYLARRIGDKKNPMSLQTRNYYVQALRRFAVWLGKAGRTDMHLLANVEMAKIGEDNRIHLRRALSPDEFGRLVDAAEKGSDLQGVSGGDRAMLYILAAWTGYRRGELSSLTLRSFDLDGPTPVVSVQAGRTKNRKAATIPLHDAVVERLRPWLAAKSEAGREVPLFALKTSGGHWRRTADMMRADLGRARAAWIEEAKDHAERERRERSDFLTYQDEDGAFADFHANRHTFVSNLAKAGVPLAVAQKLARHSDPKLTSTVYTHLEVHDQAVAIQSLPAPPASTPAPADGPTESGDLGKRVG